MYLKWGSNPEFFCSPYAPWPLRHSVSQEKRKNCVNAKVGVAYAYHERWESLLFSNECERQCESILHFTVCLPSLLQFSHMCSLFCSVCCTISKPHPLLPPPTQLFTLILFPDPRVPAIVVETHSQGLLVIGTMMSIGLSGWSRWFSKLFITARAFQLFAFRACLIPSVSSYGWQVIRVPRCGFVLCPLKAYVNPRQ